MGPRAGLDRCGKSRPPPGFDPRTVQSVASRYTDYTTWPTMLVYALYHILELHLQTRHKMTSCHHINPLTPNDPYSGCTAPLTSKRRILYIYSTNIGTEYFKRGIYSSFLSLQNAVCFIILTYLVPVLFTFHIQCVLKLKKNNSGTKRLSTINQKLFKKKKNYF